MEDCIRCGKDTGVGCFPSRQFGINITGSQPCPDPPDDLHVLHTHDHKDLGDTGHRSGHPTCPDHETSPDTHKLTISTAISLEVKERG